MCCGTGRVALTCADAFGHTRNSNLSREYASVFQHFQAAWEDWSERMVQAQVQGPTSRSQVCVLWMYQMPADVAMTDTNTAAAGRRLPLLMHGASDVHPERVRNNAKGEALSDAVLGYSSASLNRHHACSIVMILVCIQQVTCSFCL